LYFADAVIFEPNAIRKTDMEPLQMSLYIKTDKIGLQKLDLLGQPSTSLIELTEIVKLV